MENPDTCSKDAVPVASVPWTCLENPTMYDCGTYVQIGPGKYWVYSPVIINDIWGKPTIDYWQVYMANYNEPDEPYCSFTFNGKMGEGKIDFTRDPESIELSEAPTEIDNFNGAYRLAPCNERIWGKWYCYYTD